MFILQARLKHLKVILRKWAQQTFGNGNSMSSAIHEKIFQVQLDIQWCHDQPHLSTLETSLLKDFSKALVKENNMAKQKSRREWHLNGDKNTSTFHKTLKIQQFFENISSILDMHGLPCETQESIQEAFLEYFQLNLRILKILQSLWNNSHNTIFLQFLLTWGLT